MLNGLFTNPYPDLDALQEKADRNPEHLAIEPTSVCNTKCKHCGHFYVNAGEHMPAEVFELIRASLLDEAESVDLTGWGEPLIARQFPAMFDECSKRDLRVSFTSNGIKLRDDELVRKLLRSRILLRVSVDGATAETFEFVRPKIKWTDMLKTLDCIRRNIDELGDECRATLMMHFVAMKLNIQDLPEIVNLAAKHRFSIVKVLPLGMVDELELVKDQSLDGAPELIEGPVLKAIPLARELGIELDLPTSFRDVLIARQGGDEQAAKNPLGKLQRRARLSAAWIRRMRFQRVAQIALYGFGPRAKVGRTWCKLPWSQTHINADGSVYPCCRCETKLGDLTKQSWEDIWNGQAYRNIRRTIHSWNPSSVCRFCHIPIGITGGDEHYVERYFNRYRREEIPLDSSEIGFDEGFYELEKKADGTPSHRWAKKQIVVRVPMRSGARFLRLNVIPHAPLHDSVNPGKAVINGGPAEPFDNTCTEVHFPLDHVNGSEIRLEITMENSWNVEGDPREMALAISGVHLLFGK